MTEADVAELIRLTGTIILTLAGPMLAVALVSGLVVAILQAVTQINEATLVFIPKVVGIAAVLFLFGTSMLGSLTDFTRGMIDRMIAAGGT